ncbi:MAG: hypothetical protein ACREOV_11490 [Candidatus Dormibacteraceae bacterium]
MKKMAFWSPLSIQVSVTSPVGSLTPGFVILKSPALTFWIGAVAVETPQAAASNPAPPAARSPSAWRLDRVWSSSSRRGSAMGSSPANC